MAKETMAEMKARLDALEAENAALKSRSGGVTATRKPKRVKGPKGWEDHKEDTVVEVKINGGFPLRHGDNVWLDLGEYAPRVADAITKGELDNVGDSVTL